MGKNGATVHREDHQGTTLCGHTGGTRTRAWASVTCGLCLRMRPTTERRRSIAPVFAPDELAAIKDALNGVSYFASTHAKAWGRALDRLAAWEADHAAP